MIKKIFNKKSMLILAISIFFTITVFSPVISNLSNSLISETTVTITNVGNENSSNLVGSTYILGAGNYGTENDGFFGVPLESAYKNSKKNDGFDFMPTHQSGHSLDFIYARSPKSNISFEVKDMPNTWIKVLQHPSAGQCIIKYQGGEKILDLYAETEKITNIYVFEFSNNINGYLYVFYCAILYIVICIIIYISIYLIVYAFKCYSPKDYYNWRVYFFIFWLLYFIFCLFQYSVSESFLAYGDQEYYWHISDRILQSEKFNLINYATQPEYLYYHRGYLYDFLIMFVKLCTGSNKPESYFLYFAISSGIVASFITIIAPKLYFYLNNKKVKSIQVILFGILIFIFWRYYVFYPLPDIFTMITIFCFILFSLKYLLSQRKSDVFFSGFFLSIATSLRINILIIAKIVIIIIIVLMVINMVNKQKERNKTNKKFNYLYLFFIGFIIICIPQFIVNLYRGNLSLFPYEMLGSDVYSNQLLSETTVSIGFKHLTGWPYLLNNPLGESMLTSVYPDVDISHLKLLDLMILVFSQPMKFISIMFVRLFLLLDIKYPDLYTANGSAINYMSFSLYDLSKFALFSLINHVVWAISICCLIFKSFRDRLFNKKEKWIMLFLLLSFGIIVVTHGEWRYVIPIYVMAYYIVGFKISADIMGKDSCILKNKYTFIFTTLIIAIVISSLSNIFIASFS